MHFIEHNYELRFVVYKLAAEQSRTLARPPGRHSGDVMAGNVTLVGLMIFAVFDPSPLTQWINCSF